MSKAPQPLFKRVVVKLSGEALMGPDTHGLHAPTLSRLAGDLKQAAGLGAQVAVVVGGGNFFRGLEGADKGIERARADSIGMLATVMNALAMEGALEQIGQPARVLSAVAMPSLCQPYSRQAALAHLVKRRVIILAAGTGNPFFTTDTGAALRAAELSCDAVMKATHVDGIYTADPKKDPAATRYERLSHDEAIARKLQVMDTAAFALARDNGIPIVVFSVDEPGAIPSALARPGPGDLRDAVSDPTESEAPRPARANSCATRHITALAATFLDLSAEFAENKYAASSVSWAPDLKRSDPIMTASLSSADKGRPGLASIVFCGILAIGLGFAAPAAKAAGGDDSAERPRPAERRAAPARLGRRRKPIPASKRPTSRHALRVRSGTGRSTSAWRDTAAFCPIPP